MRESQFPSRLPQAHGKISVVAKACVESTKSEHRFGSKHTPSTGKNGEESKTRAPESGNAYIHCILTLLETGQNVLTGIADPQIGGHGSNKRIFKRLKERINTAILHFAIRIEDK